MALAPASSSLLFGVLGGLLGDLFQNSLGRALNQVLGLLKTEPGDGTHVLDDPDLLLTGSLQDDVELVLLLDGLGTTSRATRAGAAATATGAAAVTPKVSSNCFTNSHSSIRVISLNASSSSSAVASP